MEDLFFVGILTVVFIFLYLMVPEDVRRADYSNEIVKLPRRKHPPKNLIKLPKYPKYLKK